MYNNDKKIGKFNSDDVFLFKLTAALMTVIGIMFLL